jgi:hypothetical protein
VPRKACVTVRELGREHLLVGGKGVSGSKDERILVLAKTPTIFIRIVGGAARLAGLLGP